MHRNTTHTRANLAYNTHQRLDNNNNPQTAGPVADALPTLVHMIINSWEMTTTVLQNLTRQDYNTLRLSGNTTLTNHLQANMSGQAIPATVNFLVRCQNVRTCQQPQHRHYPGRKPIPFPRPNPPPPGVSCPHSNPNSTVHLLRCAGHQLGLNSAVGPNGHGFNYWVCKDCVSDSFHAFDFTDWLKQHVVKICADCAITLSQNNAGQPPCSCRRKYEPNAANGAFWLCTACREDYAEAVYNQVYTAAQQLPALPLGLLMPMYHPINR
jgi:hypothetical protein